MLDKMKYEIVLIADKYDMILIIGNLFNFVKRRLPFKNDGV